MAGDWIKMRKSLPTDGRIVKMMSALNADRLRTLGGLMSAWCLLDEHTEDGKLDGYTPAAFDEIIGFTGLAQAMQSVGWLEIEDGFLQAPDFQRHNGATAKRRAQESVRKMSARNADKCPQARETKSALEKRREEKSNNTPLPPEGDLLELAISNLFRAEGSNRPSAPFSAAERAKLKTLVIRLGKDQLNEDVELFGIAKLKGWEYYSRDKKTLLNQWDKQVLMANEFRDKQSSANGSGQFGLLNPQRGKC